MRAEEYDWIIYHVICDEKTCTADEICEKSDFSREQVEESLARLIKTHLVECRDDRYRVCSLEEFLITSQMNQDPFSDIFIENGVVKVKNTEKQDEEKSLDDMRSQE
ncbi:MAG TPA: helix-turn-helix domain-containing protein [Methanospirillum sp.]|uniref:helix-turn-helix domain-containing protein n=1 Tax=Methanospirillum sp. TaxID=45200 RepID=UPI002C2C10C1|nr:helix-turn-helix domain-containing protein [Methanospirillum sp.]HWQ62788.1 helix-turn-helix domain-containing protein [Methanospirillum sp.]